MPNPKCHPQNQPFFDRFSTLLASAEAEGKIRCARTYKRVLRSLKNYPLPVRSAHDAMLLEGVGKLCAAIFEEVLHDDFNVHLDQAATEQEDAWRSVVRQRIKKFMANKENAVLKSVAPARKPLKPSKSVRSAAASSRCDVSVQIQASSDAILKSSPDDDAPLSNLISAQRSALEACSSAVVPVAGAPSHVRPAKKVACSKGMHTKKGKHGKDLDPKRRHPEQSEEPVRRLSFAEAAGAVCRKKIPREFKRPKIDANSALVSESFRESVSFGTSASRAGSKLHAKELRQSMPMDQIVSLEQHVPLSSANLVPMEQAENKPMLCQQAAPSVSDEMQQQLVPLPSTPGSHKDLAVPLPCELGICNPGVQALIPLPSTEKSAVNISSSNAKLILFVDHRELDESRSAAARTLQEGLTEILGVHAFEAHPLPIGDMCWVWRGADGLDVFAGWVIERKTANDLGSSIVDGRYEEQKARLLRVSDVHGAMYLIETHEPLFGVVAETSADHKGKHKGAGRGFGERLLNRKLPMSTLSTAAVSTQLITGFHVVHTESAMQTVKFLAQMHEELQRMGPQGACMPYRNFVEQSRKTDPHRASEVFGRMLRAIPNCGPEATEALLSLAPNLHDFAQLLRTEGTAGILQRFKAKREGRSGRLPVTTALLETCLDLFTEVDVPLTPLTW